MKVIYTGEEERGDGIIDGWTGTNSTVSRETDVSTYRCHLGRRRCGSR